MTLTEFLLARIAEDEAVVHAASEPGLSDARRQFYSTMGPHGDDWGLYTFHVPPARVLAECEAKRCIIKPHTPDPCSDDDECSQCSFHEMYEGFNDHSEPWPCPTLRALATVYANHPDYDDAWRP